MLHFDPLCLICDDMNFIYVSHGHSDSDGAGDAIDPTLSPQVNNLTNIFQMG